MNQSCVMPAAGTVRARLWTLPPFVLFIPFNHPLS